MKSLRQAAQQALEALKAFQYRSEGCVQPDFVDDAITTLRQALEAEQQTDHIPDAGKMVQQAEQASVKDSLTAQAEPVAWVNPLWLPNLPREDFVSVRLWKTQTDAKQIPLYTHQKTNLTPLTNRQIMAIGRELGMKCRLGGNPNIDFDYARAIEAAHGIGGEK